MKKYYKEFLFKGYGLVVICICMMMQNSWATPFNSFSDALKISKNTVIEDSDSLGLSVKSNQSLVEPSMLNINFTYNSTGVCDNNGTPCDPSDDLMCITITINETGNFNLAWKDCNSNDISNWQITVSSVGQQFTYCISRATALAANCTNGTQIIFWIGRNFGNYNADDVFITIPVSCSSGAAPSTPSVTNASGCVGSNITLSASCSASTVQWYTSSSGGTAFQTGTSYTSTYGSAGSYTYYVSCKNTSGCESSRVPVTATVNSSPSAPTTTDGTRCGSGTVTLSASGCAGGTLKWYNAASGGTQVATGTSYSPNLSTTTTYYVDCTIGTCVSARTPVTATITANPSAPSTFGGSNCGAGTVFLSASGCSGGVLYWYNSSTGGSPFTTGSSYSPYVSSTTTYYVECQANGCLSSRTPVIATINTPPNAPSGTGASRCGTGTVTISANCSSGTVYWYNASSGGSFLGSGTNYTTPSISSTTIYYAECNTGTCASSRTAVTATVNTQPNAPSGTGASRCGTGTVTIGANCSSGTVYWYNASSGGSFLGSGTNYTTPSISSTTVYYAECNTGTCASTRTAVTATINTQPSAPSGTNASRCGTGTVTISANCSSGTVYWYNASSGGSFLGSGTNYTTPSISSTTVYYAECNTGTCVSSRTAVTATVNATPAVNITGTNIICSGSSSTLTANATANCGSINSYQWYLNSSIISGATSSTYSASSTGTYTVVVTNSCACSATSSGFTLTVNSNPTASISGITTICFGQTTTLTASGGGTYAWNTGATSASISIAPSVTTTYSVTVTNASGCTAATSQIVTVNSKPTPTAAGSTICVGGTINLSSSGGVSYAWSGPNSYSSTTQNPTIANATTNMAGTYTVIVTGANGCTASTTAVVTVVNDPTLSITGGDVTVCIGTSDVTLNSTVTGGTGTLTYQWQSSANNSTWSNISGATTNTYVVSTALSSNLYYRLNATYSGNGCNIAVSNVRRVVVNPIPTVNVTTNNTIICSGGTSTLTATISNGIGTITYQWQSSANNSTWSNISGATSVSYTTPALNTTTYYRIIITLTGVSCNSVTSASTEIKVEADPVVTVTGGATVCVGGTVTLNATVTGGLSTLANRTGCIPTSTWTTVHPEVEFCTYNLNLTYGQTFNIRDYVHIKDNNTVDSVSWSNVYFTYTAVGANNPTVPANWHLNDFNSGTNVTVTSADNAAGTGNQGQGEYRIYVVRNGQTTYDDHMTIRVNSSTSDLEASKCVAWVMLCINRDRYGSSGGTPLANVDVAVTFNGGSQTSGKTNSSGQYFAQGRPGTASVTIDNADIPAGLIAQAGSYTETINLRAGKVDALQSVFNPPSLSYQWQSSPDNTTWTNISGATSLSYTPPTNAVSNLYYRISITAVGNGCGNVASTGTQVIVVADPSVSISTTSASICLGSSYSFNAIGNGGTPSLTYQWQYNTGSSWQNVVNGTPNAAVYTGGTSNSLTISGLVVGTYQYQVIAAAIGNGCGPATSSAATIQVIAPPNAGTGTTTTACKSDVSITTDLYTLLTGEQTGGTWTSIAPFPTGMTAASINSKITSGVVERKGFPVGTYTFRYTVIGTSPCPNDNEDVMITIDPCCPPSVCLPTSSSRF